MTDPTDLAAYYIKVLSYTSAAAPHKIAPPPGSPADEFERWRELRDFIFAYEAETKRRLDATVAQFPEGE